MASSSRRTDSTRTALSAVTLTIVLSPALAVSASSAYAQSAANQERNLALGRSYTMAPRPNYALTADAGDDRQLTDGAYTDPRAFWLRSSTVGWELNNRTVTIVIDLQKVQAISGLSFSTAAGRADVRWPRSIFVLVSDDGTHFYPVGDLTTPSAESAGPPTTGYAPFRFVTNRLMTHGRYVALVIEPRGLYTFCDEIEVYGGDDSWLSSPLSGDSTSDLDDFFIHAHMRASIDRRLSADLQAARVSLAAAQVDDTARDALTHELNAVADLTPTIRSPEPNDFVAVLPLNDLHARIFAVQGLIAQADGLPELSAWPVNPWDFVRPLDKPPFTGGLDAVSIAAMNGETRAGAVCFSNSSGRALTISLHLAGLTDGTSASDVHLYEVVWTDTRELVPVADALLPLADGAATLTLPAGMTRQVWVRFSPRARAPGLFIGHLEATTDDVSLRVPLELKVLEGRFPERPTLHVGGWDYTNAYGSRYLGLTPGNVAPFIDRLHALGVDSPWATAQVMPPGRFDMLGELVEPPDTTAFDNWVASFPGASRYFVFLSASDRLGAVSATETARFAAAVEHWITFWAAHAAQMNIQPSQLMLLIVDEPHSAAQDDRIMMWAGAIKAAQPNIGIWEDPTYPDPAGSKPRLLDVSDELALERSLMVEHGATYVDFYRRRGQQGQALAIYGASGPARLLDPYTYYRLQAWVAADIGATSSFFWSFADDAGGHSWNEYATIQAPYSPFFLSDTDVTISKHSEAIHEGTEDFEYLVMLRNLTAALDRSEGSTSLSAARGILETATGHVLEAPGVADFEWTSDKDRTLAERTRLALADALDALRAGRSERDSNPDASSSTPAAPMLTLSKSAFTYDGTAHSMSAVATSPNGAPVAGAFSFTYDPGGSHAPLSAGTYSVDVAFTSGDPRYAHASATAPITVRAATPLVTVTGAFAYDGKPHGAAISVSGVGAASVMGSLAVTYTPGGTVPPLNVGDYSVIVTFASRDPNYTNASGKGSIAIRPPLFATLTYPSDGAANVELSPQFQWTDVVNVQAYSLYVGTTIGAADLVNTGQTPLTSYTAPKLRGGQPLFARLWTEVGNVWRYSDSSFTPAPIARLLAPLDGATNVDLSVPLQWTAVPGAQAYELYVGTAVGAHDLLDSRQTPLTSYAAADLPVSQILYVRLWTLVDGVWRAADSTFAAAPH